MLMGKLAGVFEDISVSTRFLSTLPGYLRRPFSIATARETIADRFNNREANFLGIIHTRVFGQEFSPYFRLMREARIDFGDIVHLVQREGVEGCLRELFRSGVFLTVDEFKGRNPVQRGSLDFRVKMNDLINPNATVHGVSESGGSGGLRTAVPIDLAAISDHAVNTLVTLECHKGANWTHAHWGRPGGTSVTNQVEFALSGNPAQKWFTPVPLSGAGIHSRYSWGSTAMKWAGRFAGVRFPTADLCSVENPLPLVNWARAVVADGRTPHIWTFASSAVRACNESLKRGLDLEGVYFTAGGEPTTDARRQTIERSGAQVLPRYGTTETDIVAFACANPEVSDEQHFLHDRLAMIQVEDDSLVPGIPAAGLMISSLLPSAPITLINVSLGDQARMTQRDCGCPLQSVGWNTHLSRILSFEKLTAGGTTFFDPDLVELLEVFIPARFGGVPTDYQLVEGENRQGEAEVRLLVNPNLGPLDNEALREFFLSRIGRHGDGEKLAELYWRSSGILRIERRVPYKSPSGKISYIHRQLDT